MHLTTKKNGQFYSVVTQNPFTETLPYATTALKPSEVKNKVSKDLE
jgi:hypothetical protein